MTLFVVKSSVYPHWRQTNFVAIVVFVNSLLSCLYRNEIACLNKTGMSLL